MDPRTVTSSPEIKVLWESGLVIENSKFEPIPLYLFELFFVCIAWRQIEKYQPAPTPQIPLYLSHPRRSILPIGFDGSKFHSESESLLFKIKTYD